MRLWHIYQPSLLQLTIICLNFFWFKFFSHTAISLIRESLKNDLIKVLYKEVMNFNTFKKCSWFSSDSKFINCNFLQSTTYFGVRCIFPKSSTNDCWNSPKLSNPIFQCAHMFGLLFQSNMQFVCMIFWNNCIRTTFLWQRGRWRHLFSFITVYHGHHGEVGVNSRIIFTAIINGTKLSPSPKGR